MEDQSFGPALQCATAHCPEAFSELKPKLSGGGPAAGFSLCHGKHHGHGSQHVMLMQADKRKETLASNSSCPDNSQTSCK